MDVISNSTGLPSVLTMCVNEFGGTLAIGAADASLTFAPSSGFQYVDMINMTRSPHYLTQVLGYGMVGKERVELPELATAVWSSATTHIVVGKVTFIALLESIMKTHCFIPGLCSTKSWFRPQACTVISDANLKKMPSITFHLSSSVPITLEPEDYLLAYQVVKGKQIRCVAFMTLDLLSTRGIGIMFGSVVMRQHAVVFDRTTRRVGVAKANVSKCGPATGTSAGLAAVVLPATGVDSSSILTADAPTVNEATGNETPQDVIQAQLCRAHDQCSGCASESKCAFRYTDSRCLPLSQAKTFYPYCQGGACLCWAGWHFGVFLGAFLAISILSCCFCVYTRHKRKVRYAMVVPFQENLLIVHAT
jgi:Eukaryotic aspartyl protease